MWFKNVIIIFLFFVLTVLQTSFFSHFALFGKIPNLTFILYFLFVFFSDKKINPHVVLYAIIAGFFLDVFSNTYLGFSSVIFLAIGFLAKNMQNYLSEKEDKYPISYFIILFWVWFLIFNFSHIPFAIDWRIILEVFYNLILAIIGFYAFKHAKQVSS